jgi:hypothetical protein
MTKTPRTKIKPAPAKPKSPWARIAKITEHPVISALVVAAVLALVGGIVGYFKASSTGTTGSSSPPAAGAPAKGFTAQVAWTQDGGGGGSASTNLYAFTGPNSHVHDGVYPLGESLTVICQTPHGRAIQVGPAYKGPNPHSTTWYKLDNAAWVPAVYIDVDHANTVPACP